MASSASRGVARAAGASRRDVDQPALPSHAIWIIAVTAMRVWLVHTFELAFSRRMSCSRVRNVVVKARRPMLSTVSPTKRPGMRRTCSRRAANRPRYGPPNAMGVPKGWPSPTATSAPHSPGLLSTAAEIGSKATTSIAPVAFAAAAAPAMSSSTPRRLGYCTTIAPGASRSTEGHRGDSVGQRHRLDLVSGPGGERSHDLRPRPVQAIAQPHTLASGGSHRQVYGLHRRRGAVVQGRIGDLEPAEAGHHRLVLEQRLEDALSDLWLVGRIGRDELGASREAPDGGGDVVVVGAAAGEADQVGTDVQARQALHLRRGVEFAQAVGNVQATGEAQRFGDALEELVERTEADEFEHRGDLAGGVRQVVGH